MVSLTNNEVIKLKRKFLSSAINIHESDLVHDINIYRIWDEMKLDGGYDKHVVMPFIVEDLIEDGLIKKGEKENEIILINKVIKEKPIPLLRIFNDIVNKDDIKDGIGVTIDVNGITITGKLMGLRPFYDEVRSMLDEAAEGSKDTYNSIFEDLKTMIPNNEKDWDVVRRFLGNHYICLKDAKRLSGGNLIPPTENDSLWIGKVESIDGFSIGLFRDR
jgi:hypothetical protein